MTWAGSCFQSQVRATVKETVPCFSVSSACQVARQLRGVICSFFFFFFKAYSVSISFNYLLLLISVGFRHMRKVLSSCHIINQRPGYGFSIFNKSTRTSVGFPALAELVVGTGIVGQEAARMETL